MSNRFDEYSGVFDAGQMEKLRKGWWNDATRDGSLSCPEGERLHYPANLLGYFVKTFGEVERDRRGYTLLMAAARAGRLDCIEVLLHFGADWTRMNLDGKTAEDMAVEAGHSDTAGILSALREEPILCGVAKMPACALQFRRTL